MLINGVPKEGFQRRAPHAPRKAREITHFPWVNSAIGRAAKFILLRLAEEQLGGAVTAAVLDRKFKENGLRQQKLYDDFVRMCPGMPAHYLEVTGRELTPHILYDRFHKTVYKNGKAGKGGKPGWSREHYASSPKMRQVAPRCEGAMLSRRPLDLATLDQLGWVKP